MDFRCYSGFGGRAPATENRQHGGRRAQSLYCAIGLAERRNKAIAPYEPTRDEHGNDDRGAIRQFQFRE
jgi:hypothetical protein